MTEYKIGDEVVVVGFHPTPRGRVVKLPPFSRYYPGCYGVRFGNNTQALTPTEIRPVDAVTRLGELLDG